MKFWKHFFFCIYKKSPDENTSKKKHSTLSIYFSFFRYANISERLGMFLACILAVGAAACQPFHIYLTGVIVNEYVEESKHNRNQETEGTYSEEIFTSNIYNSSILIVELGFLTLICLYLSGAVFSYITSRQVFKMRKEVFKKILMQDMAWYDLNQTGDFASLLSENFAKIEDGIGEKFVFFMYDQGVFISCIFWSLITRWKLTLVGLIFLPLLMIVTSAIPKLSRKLSKRASDAYGRASAITEEVFRSIRTVVIFNGQSKEIARYEKPLIDAKTNNIRNCISSGLKNATLWFFRFSGTSIPWWYGFQLIVQSKHASSENIASSPAELVTICTNISVGCFYFTIGCVYLEVFGMACGAAENIFEILDIQNKTVSNPEGEIKLKNLTGSIVFDNVFFKYPSRKDVDVLKGVSIRIKPGETVAFVGKSGSGKSTCIQLLERLYDPHSGKICIDEIDIRDLDVSWLRNNIGLVSQEAVLFANTIAENIRFGKVTATQAEIEKASEMAHIDSFIKSLPKGYETVIGERGMQLSGGQKQRIALARALVRKPCILLLDEATSALDSVSEAEVQAALESVSGNCTTIIVAHRLSTISNADQIFVFSEGEVVEKGTYLELMQMKNHFYKLRKKQNHHNSLDAKNMKTPFTLNYQAALETMPQDERQEKMGHKVEEKEKNNETFLLEILRMSIPEWGWIIFGVIASIGVGSSLCIHSILFSNILWCFSIEDEMLIKRNILLNCVSYFCIGVGAGLCYILQSYAFGLVGENLIVRIRSKMFATILNQDMEWFDKKENGIGALCGRISSDASAIQSTTGLASGMFVIFISCAISCFGLSVYNQWRLCFVLSSYPVILIISIALQQKYTKRFLAVKEESLLKSSKFAMEAINNIRTVKAFGAENFFLRHYTEQLVSYINLSRRISYTWSVVLGISSSLNLFHFATGFIYGAFIISNNIENYAQVVKVNVLMFNATWALGNIVSFISNFQNGIRGGQSIQKLFMTQPKLNNSSNNFDEVWENGNVEYKNVSFSYPTRPATTVLKDLSLSIQPGKNIALVGATGSGKSSIIQLLQRFYDPTLGQIEIDNADIKRLNLEHHRANFGVVSQEPNLFDRSIAENIAYGDNSRAVTMEEIIEAAKNANIHNFISSLPQGYDTFLGTGGTQISGGQKQRIAIARALLRNPKILILDEATSALDNENERMVQEALDKAKEGRTCITIAHRLSTIQKADLIWVIDKGEVVETGSHEELINLYGFYYQLNRF